MADRAELERHRRYLREISQNILGKTDPTLDSPLKVPEMPNWRKATQPPVLDPAPPANSVVQGFKSTVVHKKSKTPRRRRGSSSRGRGRQEPVSDLETSAEEAGPAPSPRVIRPKRTPRRRRNRSLSVPRSVPDGEAARLRKELDELTIGNTPREILCQIFLNDMCV